jgi:hypothetical protein
VQRLDPEREIQLTERVGLLAAAYPNTQIGGETLTVYARTLADIPLDVLDAAIAQCLAESEFFPTVARLREKAISLSRPSGLRLTAAEAWEQVRREIWRTGSYGDPHFADPLVNRAVAVVGWRELCLSENQVADRAHFFRVYEQLAERERQDERLLPESKELRQVLREAAEVVALPEEKKQLNDPEAIPMPTDVAVMMRAALERFGTPPSVEIVREPTPAGIPLKCSVCELTTNTVTGWTEGERCRARVPGPVRIDLDERLECHGRMMNY